MHRSSRRHFLRTSGLGAGALAVGVGVAGPAAAVEALTARVAEEAGNPLQLARVWVTRDNAHLIGELDDTHNVFEDGSVEVLLWPGDLGRLVATGLPYEITVTDLLARDAAIHANAAGRPASLKPQPGETAGEYRTLAEHNADMQMLASENPDICELITLPFKTLQGREVFGLEIAENVAKKDARPVYYNDGIHHAREWPAAEMPIMWAFDLIDSYRRATGEPERAYSSSESDPNDARMRNIVEKTRNIIIPVVNTDGFDYSRSSAINFSLTGSVPMAGMQYWRKNMRGTRVGEQFVGVNTGTPQNGFVPTTIGAQGIDNNRNYSYRWGGNGSSASQTSATYRGHEPFSEPESRNVQWVHQTYQCLAGITHHTSGDLVLWAWGDTHDDAPDDVLLARVGFACGDYNGYRPTKSIDLYVTTGTCSDYTYGTFGSVSYTFEHAGASFHPPYGDVVPSFYAANRDALMLMCELVCLEDDDRGFMHAAVDANVDVKQHLVGDFDENISNTDYTYIGNPLDLHGRHNSVIKGRVVDADGNGVKALLTNVKDFRNPLSPGNPIDEADWPELWNSSVETEEDGTFFWAVYPTTRPAVEFEGGQETITLRVEPTNGADAKEISGIYLSRGDVHDCDDIVV